MREPRLFLGLDRLLLRVLRGTLTQLTDFLLPEFHALLGGRELAGGQVALGGQQIVRGVVGKKLLRVRLQPGLKRILFELKQGSRSPIDSGCLRVGGLGQPGLDLFEALPGRVGLFRDFRSSLGPSLGRRLQVLRRTPRLVEGHVRLRERLLRCRQGQVRPDLGTRFGNGQR